MDKYESRIAQIQAYIEAYNRFNVPAMLHNLSPNMLFTNLSNGEKTLELVGLPAFEAQARQATAFFTYRQQTITSITHREDETEVDIDYIGILAMDLPNGLQAGDTLRLQGKSIFRFEGAQIVQLTDFS